MLKVYYNSNGSADYIHVKDGEYTIFEGHNITIHDLVFLLQRYTEVQHIDLTDEEMEQL